MAGIVSNAWRLTRKTVLVTKHFAGKKVREENDDDDDVMMMVVVVVVVMMMMMMVVVLVLVVSSQQGLPKSPKNGDQANFPNKIGTFLPTTHVTFRLYKFLCLKSVPKPLRHRFPGFTESPKRVGPTGVPSNVSNVQFFKPSGTMYYEKHFVTRPLPLNKITPA